MDKKVGGLISIFKRKEIGWLEKPTELFCLFDLFFTTQSTIFSYVRMGLPGLNQYIY